MPDTVSSSSTWLRGVVQLFDAQGLDTAALFRQAGLDIALLAHPQSRFATRGLDRLWALAVAAFGKPSLGLDRQLARRYVNFEIAAQAMWPAHDLDAGLKNLARYLGLIGDSAAFTIQAERGDRWLVLAHGTDGASPRERIEFGMLALLMLCQRVTRRPLRPLSADFSFPEPADLHAHRMAFHCPLRFGQPANRMRLARADLELAIARTTPSLVSLHERVLEGRLARLGSARTSYRASEEMIRRLHLGEPRRADVARCLGLTDAALRQRLKAEGHSFEDLLLDVRRELAAHYSTAS